MSAINALIVSLFISLAIVPLAIKLAKYFKILYYPRQDTMNQAPVPLLGGGVIFIGLFSAVFMFGTSINYLAGIIIAVFIVFLVGLIDDIKKRGSSSSLRFLAHCFSAAIIIACKIKFNLLQNPVLDYIITVLWIVGLANAFNMLDGLDGLCAGIAAICAIAFLLVGLLLKQAPVVVISAGLLGVSIGVLFYNFYPAKIYLGSSGSTLLGFMLAVVSILAQSKENKFSYAFALLLIFAVPISDLSLTTYTRVKNKQVRSIKQWFDYKGKDHIHYRLLNKGLKVKTAVLILYGVSLFVGFAGFLYIKTIK
jgi:UDP-GlcNAc:undecaprenyl-phosphate GlcNAc-1-phosphate transferase